MFDYGSHNINIDIDYHKTQFRSLLEEQKCKVTGLKGHNLFCNVPKNDKKILQDYMVDRLGQFNDWNFDYFHSGEPAGLHTDYETVPWDDKVDCQVIVGCIIPLEWNCKQPYTVNYNRVSDIPRKLMYRQGEMRYRDNDEIFEYRTNWNYDEEVLKYNPKDCLYAKEYADLKVHSVYEWKIGTMMLFDTARWHSSSWFLSTPDIQEMSKEWKRAIIGFGSIDVQRN